MPKPIRIAGISGSLRQTSYNSALLRNVQPLLPGGVELTMVSIDQLPLYNADLGEIGSVIALNEAILEVDAVLFATPEYNYGLPGPLKNAIDWASRPVYRSPFAGKPVGMLGATGSAVGTARAQAHLKQVMLGMLAHVFPWPEFLIGGVKAKFRDGELVDPITLEYLQNYLNGFVAFIDKVSD